MNENEKKRERGRRWIWWVVALVLVVALIVWAQMRPPEVVVERVERGDLLMTVTATGEVEGMVANVAPTIQGQVEAIYRDEGDWVRRGDLLCRIIAGPGAGATTGVLSAYETITAPFDGIISRRYVDPGDSAIPGQPVFQVADPSEMWVTALIDDIDVGRVRTGQEVQIILPSYLGQNLTGRIERLAATATPRTAAGIGGRVVRARVQLTGGAGSLRPGMEVDVATESVVARDALLVPADAVIEDELGRWVFIVEGGSVQRREVAAGATNYVQAEVTSGLAQGEMVVVEGKEELAPGDAVRVTERSDRE
ncbi:MAG: efflux RND transporter periplasmic adaptor subunit [candidate division WS1 bacterium]|jgi:multidrug efflux pump subunit AcrA (membrane-fusion protein)|nr:efflux RND transporter periplasmic adaptor subunit [candidate division WS1 bacterium]